jgi:hypothetical protein
MATSKDYGYHLKFPNTWRVLLTDALGNTFGSSYFLYTSYKKSHDSISYFPPVNSSSWIGKIAGKFPSKPQGITLWGTIYYTPGYPKVRNKYEAKYGKESARLYEFGMYAHETYHAIEQEIHGKLKWFIKYIFNLVKTPNAYSHPMEKPAYQFQEDMKQAASKNLPS